MLYDNRCNSVSRLDKHLSPDGSRFVKSSIGMVPPDGYSKRDIYSKSPIQWLKWMMRKHVIHIKHALNEGGYRIPGTKYRTDGYHEASGTVYEFHGCVYYGCPTCFPHDRTTTTHPTTNQLMEALYVVTKKREIEIKSRGYKYVAIWDNYQRQLKRDKGVKNFVNTLDV